MAWYDSDWAKFLSPALAIRGMVKGDGPSAFSPLGMMTGMGGGGASVYGGAASAGEQGAADAGAAGLPHVRGNVDLPWLPPDRQILDSLGVPQAGQSQIERDIVNRYTPRPMYAAPPQPWWQQALRNTGSAPASQPWLPNMQSRLAMLQPYGPQHQSQLNPFAGFSPYSR